MSGHLKRTDNHAGCFLRFTHGHAAESNINGWRAGFEKPNQLVWWNPILFSVEEPVAGDLHVVAPSLGAWHDARAIAQKMGNSFLSRNARGTEKCGSGQTENFFSPPVDAASSRVMQNLVCNPVSELILNPILSRCRVSYDRRKITRRIGGLKHKRKCGKAKFLSDMWPARRDSRIEDYIHISARTQGCGE